MLGCCKDAGGTTDNALARRWQWAISRWKNRGLDAAGDTAERRGVADEERTPTSGRRARDEALRGAPAAYQAVDFDDLIGLPVKLLARDAEVRAPGSERCATCWSTSTRTPTPCSTSC